MLVVIGLAMMVVVSWASYVTSPPPKDTGKVFCPSPNPEVMGLKIEPTWWDPGEDWHTKPECDAYYTFIRKSPVVYESKHHPG
jgi:hypothetical protein